MKPQELRELDAWIFIHVFDWHPFKGDPNSLCETCGQPIGPNFKHWVQTWQMIGNALPRPTTDPAAAMMVLVACYNMDMNSYLASFHNFLVRPDHDRSLTPLQICLFAKKLFGGSNE